MHILRRVSPHVFWFSPLSQTDRPALAAIVGKKRTLWLDAGNSPAHVSAFLTALRTEGIGKPDFCAITHAHWDHFFGGSALNVPLIAHQLTACQIQLQAGYEWTDAALDQRVIDGTEITFCRDMIKAELPNRSNLTIAVPEIIFHDELTLDLGGVTCRICHVGGDHAADSCVMYIPEEKVLFLGDCLYPAIYAPERYYTVDKVSGILDKLNAFDVEYAIFGHDGDVFTRDAWQGDMFTFRRLGELVRLHGTDRDAITHKIRTEALPDKTWAQELAGLYLSSTAAAVPGK
ncbi:MAG TPA: MBL fold metallo-hydrolase [Phototrophicaceae bacterium]|jgi:glyoxylase-like metal-dependent hydrolase (beta-lactamase superfamily II)|nr:MBL fold metallo-hydrolase [Phototrophicaceae bacterium]